MFLLLAAADVAEAVKSADTIASGLEKGPIAYVAALSLLANAGLFVMLMRVQSLRVEELKAGAERAEKLGGIIEKHNQAMGVLERAVAFVMAQQPASKRKAAAVDPLTDTGSHPVVKP